MDESSFQQQVQSFLRGPWEGIKRIHGLKGGAGAYLLSILVEKRDKPVLIVAPTAREAESLYQDLLFFLGNGGEASPLEKRVHQFPPWEVLPLERLSPHPDNVAARLEGLYYLLQGQAPVLVSTPAALMQRMIPRKEFQDSFLYLVLDEDLSSEGLLQRLVQWGYQNVPLVEERGDFSVRGGIVDIFPPAYDEPIRIEFDGDRVASIRAFDPSSQRSGESHQEFLLLPMKEFSLKRAGMEEIARAIEMRASELEIGRSEKNAILQSLREGVPFAGMEFMLPYFYPSLSSFLSYLPPDTLVWFDQAGHVEAEAERFEKLVWQRAAKAKEEGRFTPPVESLYLSAREWQEALGSFSQVHSESLDISPPKTSSDHRFLAVKSYLNTDIHHDQVVVQGKEPSLAPFVARLKDWREERVFFVAPSRGDAKRLQELLAHYEVSVPSVGGFASFTRNGGKYGISVGGLAQGFRLPHDRLVLVTSDEIFGTRKRQQPLPKKTRPSHFITNLTELKQDNYVVHLDHGVGIYRGLKFLKVSDAEGEFLQLEYEGGDRLYLPVDRINLIQKYVGGDGAQPALDRLGGTSWERVKARTRKSVLAMAEELVGIYAAREVHEGHAFATPDQHYREFEAAFEFEETQDQERAIEDTLRDMQKKRPMDRLICGDVGYGKTEVALRAAFLAVMEGKQVAILVPTTILAQQHYQTFCHRLRNYPVQVEMLSRFLVPKESQRVLDELAKGVVDIVIGTHRLLQKDVRFKELGLAVIDEEHRFGVVHKERLKKLRHQVDVISLTATPIPRTLHMSLVGIRDMSIIETPPSNRLAVRTYITRYDESVIRDAVLRELNRGGQVFFLHNRVETISRMAQKLSDLVPEAKIAVAHGQMAPRDLEKVMLGFFENRTQVLVCSAIIESGLDFPNANTIIINRADRFGLAQLYQLRGRVGRSHRRAYAYLLVPAEGHMTRDAEKRLRALQELDHLGGGFKLALHDLEIRGAGNLLGKEQSGQIAAVGLELYTRMLEEAVKSLQGEVVDPEVEPEIRLGIPAYFPEEFIPDTNQRLYFYKRLASAKDAAELGEIRQEIRDRYGRFPEMAENLFKIMELRRTLKENLVQQVIYHDGRLSLLFHSGSPVKPERLLEAMERNQGRYRLSPEGRLSFPAQNPSWEGIIPEVIDFLQGLH